MIPEDIVRFIFTSIPSIPYLEAALLLQRDPLADWTVTEVARALYITEPLASELLTALAAGGIASESATRYRYAPRDASLSTMLDRLSEQYRAAMIEITQLVHDTTARNAHRFASAFNVRKET